MLVRTEFLPLLRAQRTLLHEVNDTALVSTYEATLRKTFAAMKPALPAKLTRILDIGSGLGGINVLLSAHYGHAVEIWALDGSGMTEGPLYGYSHDERFYADLDTTAAFLADNGVPAENVKTVDILTELFPKGPFGLIFSLASWGFHYPIQTYARRVAAALAAGGTLIVEIRKGTPAEIDAKRAFGLPKVLADFDKRAMFAFRR